MKTCAVLYGRTSYASTKAGIPGGGQKTCPLPVNHPGRHGDGRVSLSTKGTTPMTTQPKPVWYGTFFDHLHCDAITKKNNNCRMVPLYLERATGLRYCSQHAAIEFARLRAEFEAMATR